jgi:hypothetical protein
MRYRRVIRNLSFFVLLAAIGAARYAVVHADPWSECGSVNPIPQCDIILDSCSQDLNNDGDFCDPLCTQFYGRSGWGNWFDADTYICHCGTC